MCNHASELEAILSADMVHDTLHRALADLIARWRAEGAEREQTDLLADDPEYAALVAEQLRVGREIDKNRRLAAWLRMTAGRDGETEHSAHPTMYDGL